MNPNPKKMKLASSTRALARAQRSITIAIKHKAFTGDRVAELEACRVFIGRAVNDLWNAYENTK